MSDAGRKDFSTKAKEHITPDSTKSTQQKLKETVTGAGDKAARGAQPDHEKSLGQEATDKVSRSHDREVHGSSGGSIIDKTKGALGLDKH